MSVKFHLVTLFPEFFDSPLEVSLVGKAIEGGMIEIEFHDPRSHGTGVHKQVDDAPFGGGAGMVMAPGPLAEALDPLAATHRILLTPSGIPLSQGPSRPICIS